VSYFYGKHFRVCQRREIAPNHVVSEAESIMKVGFTGLEDDQN
jgi:hypothetical protein